MAGHNRHVKMDLEGHVVATLPDGEIDIGVVATTRHLDREANVGRLCGYGAGQFQ